MNISELTPKQLRFWNQMRESHLREDFAQLQAQLRQDRALLDFCSAALIQSAKEGDLETTKLLLEVGATLNREHDGTKYCDALLFAAGAGQLNTVKLLVDGGADLTAEDGYGGNAMMNAEFFGHDDVAAYLSSLGMIDLEEIRIYDFQSAHDTILERIADSRGMPSQWKLGVPGDPYIELRHIPAQSGRRRGNGQIIFTVGLSDHRLPLGRFKSHYTELQMHLPPEWPLAANALSQTEWSWPIEWMKRIACQLRSADRISDSPLFMNGARPQPLGPNTSLCGWVGEEYEGAEGTYDVEGSRTVNTLVLFPILEDEVSVIEQDGVGEFTRRLYIQAERRGEPSFRIIDPLRPSVAGDDY